MSVVQKSQSHQALRRFTTLTTDFYINFIKIEKIDKLESVIILYTSQNLSNAPNYIKYYKKIRL